MRCWFSTKRPGSKPTDVEWDLQTQLGAEWMEEERLRERVASTEVYLPTSFRIWWPDHSIDHSGAESSIFLQEISTLIRMSCGKAFRIHRIQTLPSLQDVAKIMKSRRKHKKCYWAGEHLAQNIKKTPTVNKSFMHSVEKERVELWQSDEMDSIMSIGLMEKSQMQGHQETLGF